MKLPAVVFAPQMIIGFASGFMLPNAIAGAVSIRPQTAGTASGLLGCLQMAFGALTTQLAIYVVAGATTVTPIMLHMFAVGVGALLAYLLLLRPHGSGRKRTD